MVSTIMRAPQKPKPIVNINICITPELHEAISEYQVRYEFPSKSETLRFLLAQAVVHLKPQDVKPQEAVVVK
jgi:hypothetical protein